MATAAEWRRGLDSPLAARLATAAELARQRRESAARCLPAGHPSLLRLLGDGLRAGETVELVGERSSGRFSLALAALAATTSCGESAALVDLGDALDPQLAAACGVALPHLLWARPQNLRQALAAAEIALQSGMPLVVLDLGERPIPGGRGIAAQWQRLARVARQERAALLLSTPCRVSGPAAAMALHARPRGACWRGRGTPLLVGLGAALGVEKGRGGDWGRQQGLRLLA